MCMHIYIYIYIYIYVRPVEPEADERGARVDGHGPR